MKVILDVAHPAHVHFYRHLYGDLRQEGAEVFALARRKEVTTELLEAFGIPYELVSTASRGSWIGGGREILTRTAAIARAARRMKVDVILTRNPAGVLAARLAGATGVFDTDNGREAGLHFSLGVRAAHVVTSPASLDLDLGPKHRTYSGYKALAYLHPDRFCPDRRIKQKLGLDDGRPVFMLRLVAMAAAHDHAERGMPPEVVATAVDRMRGRGHVVLSAESPHAWPGLAGTLTSDPATFLDLLAAADLCIGDSGSVTAEASMLGVPALWMHSFHGRIAVMKDLERRFLFKGFTPDDGRAFLVVLDDLLADLPTAKGDCQRARDVMLQESVDVTGWYRDLVMALA